MDYERLLSTQSQGYQFAGSHEIKENNDGLLELEPCPVMFQRNIISAANIVNNCFSAEINNCTKISEALKYLKTVKSTDSKYFDLSKLDMSYSQLQTEFQALWAFIDRKVSNSSPKCDALKKNEKVKNLISKTIGPSLAASEPGKEWIWN